MFVGSVFGLAVCVAIVYSVWKGMPAPDSHSGSGWWTVFWVLTLRCPLSHLHRPLSIGMLPQRAQSLVPSREVFDCLLPVHKELDTLDPYHGAVYVL